MPDRLDEVDRGALANLWCPDCGGRLIAGPRGGAAQNFYCSNRISCRQGFSLTFVDGKLAFAERIGDVDNERFAMYAERP